MDEFLEQPDAIVLINEKGQHFGHYLTMHEIIYEAMIRMPTGDGGTYYFLRTDPIIKDMQEGYNVFHFKTNPQDVRVLSKDVVKISETTNKEKRGEGLKMTASIEF